MIECDLVNVVQNLRLDHFATCLSAVGSAWLALLKDGKVIMNEQPLPVASNLPAGYLSAQDCSTKVREQAILLCKRNNHPSLPLR